MTILLFFAVLFVLILVHEWGHYIVAKKTGMQVDEFGIGFPPKLFGFTYGETEYTFNLLPIGGFVKILGEDAVGADATGARDRSFIAKSKWAQAAVLLAGVTMNVLFAWVLFAAVYMVGVPQLVDESTATESAQLYVTQVLPGSPADSAGLPVGAEVVSVSVNDEVFTNVTPVQFRELTEASLDSVIAIRYEAAGAENTVEVTPAPGVIATDPERAAVGVGLSLAETVRMPFFASLLKAADTTWSSLGAIVVGLSDLLFGAIVGTADFTQVAGPIGIAGMVGDAAAFGLTSLLMFTAIISLNLAVINLLPFPALDGGRLLFVAYEAITRRPINPIWVMRLNTAGFLLLIGLMIAVTYSDIVKLF